MRTLRLLTFVIVATGVLAPKQAFAQDDPTQPTLNLQLPSVNVQSPAPTFGPASFAAKPPATAGQRNEQGLGFFVQGGWVNTQVRGGEEIFPSTAFSTSANGYFFGVAFGGNKSGKFGIGADVNYFVKNADNIWLFNEDDEVDITGDLEQHFLQVAVYGRVNFFGHVSKNDPTLYIIFGGFVDILLKGEINGIDIKDQFNGFQVGPNFGVGFEAYRFGVELRFDWSVTALNSTGDGTFLNGLEGTRDFKTILLFRFRIN